jgi:glycine C-acetyltransferase
MPLPNDVTLLARTLSRLGDNSPTTAPGAERVVAAAGAAVGLNFATQDYLSLAGIAAIRAVAAAQPGDNPALMLQDRLARFLQLPETVLFANRTDAIRATLAGLLHPGDEVIVDRGAHPAIFETVLASGARLHSAPAGSVDAVERRLRRLAAQPRRGRLFVAVPAVAPTTSVIADLPTLLDLARDHGARLIVDVAHDLGSMGHAGGGVAEIQGCLGKIDVVIGSFTRCFGATGGFAASCDPALTSAIRQSPARHGPSGMPAVNASAILAAFDIVDSPQGRNRRRRLHGNALRLRNHLMADGLPVLGQPSPFVPLRLPHPTAQARTALIESAGAIVTLLRAPLVAGHAPRWRLHLMADHSAADIDDLADLIRDVARVFDRHRASRSLIMPAV